MIVLRNTRFGDLALPREAELSFPRGLIGFAAETRFAIVEREHGRIAYLQSLRTPHLALPVIDASWLYPTYGKDEVARFASDLVEDLDDLLVLVVVSASPDGTLLANLLAPLLIDAKTRRGAQTILDAEKYGARVVIGAPPPPPEALVVG